MKRWVFILAGILLNQMLACGQTTGYSRFYDWQTGYRDTFPEWFFQSQRGGYTGVSDPCLKPGVAREQALQRALFLYVLNQGTEVNMLFDYFTSAQEEIQAGKFIVLATFGSGEEKVYKYTVLNERISEYGEVCISIRPGEEGEEETFYSFAGEMMLVENKERNEKREFKIALTFHTPRFDDLKESFFSYKGNSEFSKIEQKLNGETAYIPRGRYMYADGGQKAGEYEETYQLFDAYWCALAESLLNEVVLYSFPSVYIKKVNDAADFSQYELKREVVSDCIRLEISRVGIQNNQLYIGWKCESMGKKNEVSGDSKN